MNAHLKNAAITTATVLVTIYLLRQFSATKNVVDKVFAA